MLRAVWPITKVLKNHICQGKLVLQTKRESYIKVRTCHHCYGPMKAEENKFFCYNFSWILKYLWLQFHSEHFVYP